MIEKFNANYANNLFPNEKYLANMDNVDKINNNYCNLFIKFL